MEGRWESEGLGGRMEGGRIESRKDGWKGEREREKGKNTYTKVMLYIIINFFLIIFLFFCFPSVSSFFLWCIVLFL